MYDIVWRSLGFLKALLPRSGWCEKAHTHAPARWKEVLANKNPLRELGLPNLLAKPHSLAHFGRSLSQYSLIHWREGKCKNLGITWNNNTSLTLLKMDHWTTKGFQWENPSPGCPSTYPSTYPSTSLQVPYWLSGSQKINGPNHWPFPIEQVHVQTHN